MLARILTVFSIILGIVALVAMTVLAFGCGTGSMYANTIPVCEVPGSATPPTHRQLCRRPKDKAAKLPLCALVIRAKGELRCDCYEVQGVIDRHEVFYWRDCYDEYRDRGRGGM